MATSVRLGVGVVVAIGLAATVGCGPQKVTASGKVTYQGKPVVSGGVSLVASDSVMYTGAIAPDGTFSISDVPTGPVKIGVNSPNPGGTVKKPAPRSKAALKNAEKKLSGDNLVPDRRKNSDAKAPSHPPGWVTLPPQYADPLKSGLTGVVKWSESLDIDIP